MISEQESMTAITRNGNVTFLLAPSKMKIKHQENLAAARLKVMAQMSSTHNQSLLDRQHCHRSSKILAMLVLTMTPQRLIMLSMLPQNSIELRSPHITL